MSLLYAFAAGWNVALGNLHNVQDTLYPLNVLNGKPVLVTIASSIIDPFPVRVGTVDGAESGDGYVNQDWFLSLVVGGYKYLLDTFFSSETVVATPLTVYTRRHEHADFVRYNVQAILPSPLRNDVTFIRPPSWTGVFVIKLPLRDLVASV